MTARRGAALSTITVVTAVVVAAALVGPSGATTAKTIVKVRLKGSTILLDRPSAQRWFVNFAVANRDDVPHEFLILKTMVKPWKLPVKSGRAVEAGRVRRFGTLLPGEARQHGLNLTPGKYVLLCNLPGHYQAGQRVAFTVT